MKFELDDILISDILFYMENQNNAFFLDTEKAVVVEAKKPGNNLIPLPEWTPSDGFRLMEHFTAGLKNPAAKQELTEALNKNKGVFRAFKDILENYPPVEKQFNQYKTKKMRERVIGWYNALREEWGLEPIGEEPEDTTGLVLEDFDIQETAEFEFAAKTANGEIACALCAVKKPAGLQITKLETAEQYRGLGLAKTLLAKFLEKAGNQSVIIDLPHDADFFARALLLENFKPVVQRFLRKGNLNEK